MAATTLALKPGGPSDETETGEVAVGTPVNRPGGTPKSATPGLSPPNPYLLTDRAALMA
jgi:hypothetical protein